MNHKVKKSIGYTVPIQKDWYLSQQCIHYKSMQISHAKPVTPIFYMDSSVLYGNKYKKKGCGDVHVGNGGTMILINIKPNGKTE